MTSIKSFLMSTILICCCIPCNAQISLTAYDILYEGKFNMALGTGFAPGAAGANQVWDFSGIKPRTTFKYQIVKFNGNGNGNMANLAKVDGKDTFAYYLNNGSACYEVMPLQNFDKVDYRNLKTFSYPFGFNGQLKDSIAIDHYYAGAVFGMPSLDSLHLIFKMNYKANADAWGLLKLPSGDVQSLRIRSETITTVRMFGKTGNQPYQPVSIFDEDDTLRQYQWYAKNKGGALATYDLATREMEYRVSEILSNSKVWVRHDLLITNPVSDGLSIKNNGPSSYAFRLMDIKGVCLLTGNSLSGSDTVVPLPSLTEGIYLLQLRNMETGALSFEKLVKSF